jgi:hypothetical protein
VTCFPIFVCLFGRCRGRICESGPDEFISKRFLLPIRQGEE